MMAAMRVGIARMLLLLLVVHCMLQCGWCIRVGRMRQLKHTSCCALSALTACRTCMDPAAAGGIMMLKVVC
jgi:hypothetical protein